MAGSAYVIGIEDIILDRIQAAKHWNSQADEEQAVRMGAVYYEDRLEVLGREV